MSATLTYKGQSSSAVASPPTGYYRLFLGDGSDNTAGQYYKKDSAGTVTALVPAAFTQEDAQDAVGALIADSNSLDFTYDDAGNVLSAVVRIPVQALTSGPSKAYAKSDHGSYFRRSNAGAAMTDTLPNLNTQDNGYYVKVQNLGTTTAETITFTAGSGATIGELGATTYVLKYGCRQTFVYDGLNNIWRFDAGNGNLFKTYTGATSGDLLAVLDSAGVGTVKATARMIENARNSNDGTGSQNRDCYNVLAWGLVAGDASSGTAAANVTAMNTLLASMSDNGTVFFPPGPNAYYFSSAIAIPAGKHITILGAGNQKSMIYTTSATADIFTVGDWYNTFNGIKFGSTVTRTAGRAIYSGNNVAMDVYNCDFAGMWDGIVYSGGANAGNLAVVSNCNWTDIKNRGMVIDGQNANTILDTLVMDSPSGQHVACLELNQCGSLVVSNCDFIRAQNNLKINPTSPNGVFSAYFVNTFFDSSPASSVKFMGTGNIQRIKFVSCWFSGSVIGCEFASTAATLPTAIDFVACDIFGNSGRGIYGNGVQDFSVNSSRISGNTTAGIEIVASAGSVTKMNVQNTAIGPTAGFGANGVGVLINAGTYGGIVIQGNDLRGNTTPLTNGATSTTPQIIGQNLGLPTSGGVNPAAAALAAATTYVTPTISAPANSLRVGSTFRFKVLLTNTATAVTTTILGKAGPNGTTADTTTVSLAPAAATVAAVGAAEIEVTMFVRSVGAAGVIVASAKFNSTGGFSTAVSGAAVLATATVNTTVANFFGVALTESAAVVTMQSSYAEVVNQ